MQFATDGAASCVGTHALELHRGAMTGCRTDCKRSAGGARLRGAVLWHLAVATSVYIALKLVCKSARHARAREMPTKLS